MGEDEIEGASIQEQLIEACRRDNVELMEELLADRPDAEKTALLNNTTTVMGNHLYHEAALQGNYDVIDLLLDQPEFECDPVNRREGDTPLHSAIRWINSEPAEQREFGNALVQMMLEAGSSTRARNKSRLTPYQLVDPQNKALRDLIQEHEYTALNAGDFVNDSNSKTEAQHQAIPAGFVDSQKTQDDDDDAEFSGSDDEERAEFEKRKASKGR